MFYHYTVKYYDECGTNHYPTGSGYVFAHKYGEAVDYLEEVYGADNIFELALKGLGEGCIDNVMEVETLPSLFGEDK